MDIQMNYEEARGIVKENGWDHFLESFKDKYKQLKLYACSMYWFNDRKYICKFRGTGGDLILTWFKEGAEI